MTILIVEDEPTIVTLWRRILRNVSQDIRWAKDIAGAFREMRTIPHPDLVLLDLVLPGSSARQTLEQINALKDINPNAVVLVITGSTDDFMPALASSLGADGFRFKPQMASQNALLEAIKCAFENRRAKQGEKPYERTSELLAMLNGLLAA